MFSKAFLLYSCLKNQVKNLVKEKNMALVQFMSPMKVYESNENFMSPMKVYESNEIFMSPMKVYESNLFFYKKPCSRANRA